MKAKQVYESLTDVLLPKSKEQIKMDVKNNPLANMQWKIKNACEEYWKKKGIKFGVPNSPEILGFIEGESGYSVREFGWNSAKLYEGKSFIPDYAEIEGTQMGVFNQLYGRFMLKNGKWSTTTQRIAYKNIFS
jgi:hypothetical protein